MPFAFCSAHSYITRAASLRAAFLNQPHSGLDSVSAPHSRERWKVEEKLKSCCFCGRYRQTPGFQQMAEVCLGLEHILGITHVGVTCMGGHCWWSLVILSCIDFLEAIRSFPYHSPTPSNGIIVFYMKYFPAWKMTVLSVFLAKIPSGRRILLG